MCMCVCALVIDIPIESVTYPIKLLNNHIWNAINAVDVKHSDKTGVSLAKSIQLSPFPLYFQSRQRLTPTAVVSDQLLTSGCLVTSGRCRPSTANEEWYILRKGLPAQWQYNIKSEMYEQS